MSIKIDISYGELLDKITILEIKSERISDKSKLVNVTTELEVLNSAWSESGLAINAVESERVALKSINEDLWEIEDAIRKLEAKDSFGEEFVNLARSVYKTNDKRAAVKRTINDKLGSVLVEEKSYQPY
ncbi:MAG: DUF6165 family protein [Gammaproteobacteria bacterium]